MEHGQIVWDKIKIWWDKSNSFVTYYGKQKRDIFKLLKIKLNKDLAKLAILSQISEIPDFL